MQRITLRDLELVSAIAETGSLTNASRRLHVTQPAVSQRLASLTDRVGLPLVERHDGRSRLTPAGERLLASAERVGAELARAARDIDALAAAEVRELRISTQCYTCYRWLPFVLATMRDDFPELHVDVVPEATDAPYESMVRDEIDVAIVASPRPGYDFDEIPLFGDEFYAVMHKNHPLAKRRRIEPAAFTGQTLILYTGKKYAIVEEVLKPAGVSDYKVIPVRITEAIIELARGGNGIAVIAGWALDDIDNTGELVAVRIGRSGFTRQWTAVVGPRAQPEQVKRLVKHIRTVGRAIGSKGWRKRLEQGAR